MDHGLPETSLPPLPVDLPRKIALSTRSAAPAFERAIVRLGRSEHEWLQTKEGEGSDFEHGQARMLVLPGRCIASTDDAPIEIELVISRGTAAAVADLLYRLPGGSTLAVEDAWDWPMFDAIPDEREDRASIELPDGRVRISARLEAGGRLCVRLAQPRP
ncbi:MAG: hypothetical protein FJ260_04135 [Planctomycetes bacterium]|nr:hypothetical protein [Planctomycetota bacterium]